MDNRSPTSGSQPAQSHPARLQAADRPAYSFLDTSMPKYAQQYEDALYARGLSADTIRCRAWFARAWLARHPDPNVPSGEIVRWLRRWDGWTRKTYHAHLTSLYGWLVESGHLDADPTVGIKRTPTPRAMPTPLAEVDLTRALVAATPRVRAYLTLGYLAGLRASEIAKFHGRDVTAAAITVVGKGGQKWTIPTHPLVWDLAQTYSRDGYWFPSPQAGRAHLTGNTISKEVGTVFRSIGIPAGSAHRARHTYGTQLLRNGANVRVVQTLMRHASLATTERYLLVEEDERRAAVVSLLLPDVA